MNEMIRIALAPDDDRRDLFLTTAQRLGTAPENIEKDFWVCWTLDALYNKAVIKPRLLFKGGTSLSKAWGLIERFSEDIDITVFRTDFDGAHFPTDDELVELSRKKREAILEDIKATCQGFIAGPFHDALKNVADAELGGMSFRFEGDSDDPDGQSLLFHYPSAFRVGGKEYVRRVVKIESGAKSALDPHRMATVTPYVADDVDLDLDVTNVRAILPERTFWDKVVILHGQRRWFENRGSLYKDGQRLSRHYYDVYCMLMAGIGQDALGDLAMAEDCASHARLFFNRGPLDLESAVPGTFALVPSPDMVRSLEDDYGRMAGMIFGEAPPFEDIVDAISDAEEKLNAVPIPPS
ncbi:MAG: nucleotidyl transferase AbiEii/AbiGii toxin family protein [Desulfovibrio sp.]|uniref:nucleotidyl transferase AbiEii/AbiGii toxin family protein n=1 Tax=Desulfovibrio sp. TaxID=885 RepID=UPI00135D40E0|nr:nucleotidyl transferase AbiEii/AbiGii toxin family protein [Desulfovibrio sp.]MTJ93949.1 nucleotidyl transferase AbiEii/AbiGii toxin family protein [Desulfovibrio sp.]